MEQPLQFIRVVTCDWTVVLYTRWVNTTYPNHPKPKTVHYGGQIWCSWFYFKLVTRGPYKNVGWVGSSSIGSRSERAIFQHIQHIQSITLGDSERLWKYFDNTVLWKLLDCYLVQMVNPNWTQLTNVFADGSGMVWVTYSELVVTESLFFLGHSHELSQYGRTFQISELIWFSQIWFNSPLI